MSDDTKYKLVTETVNQVRTHDIDGNPIHNGVHRVVASVPFTMIKVCKVADSFNVADAERNKDFVNSALSFSCELHGQGHCP